MKKILHILTFIILLILGLKIFNYILKDDYGQYTRITMHELYNQDKNIDVLFVGSSHVYRTFVPKITDKEFKCNTFNLGTSGQDMLGSYTLIKETLKKNKVKKIYLDIYYAIALMKPYKQRNEFTDVYIISDYMKLSINKINYLINSTPNEYYINDFVPSRRYWNNIYNFKYIMNNINKKKSSYYKNYEWDKKIYNDEFYVEKGFVASNLVYDAENYFNIPKTTININDINPDWIKYLNKIIKLCKKKNISLSLITVPLPINSIMSIDNYEDFNKYINKISKKNKIEYIDFNLINENYFNTSDFSLFKDEDHLNYKGAKAFTKVFTRYINNHISKEELFYDNLEDKLNNVDISIR